VCLRPSFFVLFLRPNGSDGLPGVRLASHLVDIPNRIDVLMRACTAGRTVWLMQHIEACVPEPRRVIVISI
jgi:hypothetical protein